MTTLSVWAPSAERVDVEVGGEQRPLAQAAQPGWWQLVVADAGHGTDYAFRIDGGDPRPDPRSAWQPSGVHGPSRIYDQTAFTWTDETWRGVFASIAEPDDVTVGATTLSTSLWKILCDEADAHVGTLHRELSLLQLLFRDLPR